ncbi:MAG: rod shape-determining protein MreD [Succinivibrio sp.]|nr:rod shape-determining protein MreD [Succinivibrio sp.]
MSNKNSNYHSIYLLFLPLLFISLILQVIRLPEILDENRPDVILLVLLFFALINNKQVTIIFAWFTGLILDILSGATFGINALMLATQFYLILTPFSHFPQYRLWQQALIIGIVNLIVHIFCYWFEHLIGITFYRPSFLIPSGVLVLLWPIAYFLLAILCNAFSIAIKPKENSLT